MGLPQFEHYLPLAVVGLVQICLLADQEIIPLHMSSIAYEYGFDDIERDEKLGGNTTAVFFLFSAISSLLVGRVSDSICKIKLLACLSILGGCGSMLTSCNKAYTYLLLCRAIVGVAVGGVAPIGYAALADVYEPEERPKVITIFSIFVGGGKTFGQLFALNCGWHVSFIIVGLIALGVGLMLPRLWPRTQEGKSSSSSNCNNTRTSKDAVKKVLTTPSAVLVFLQGLFGCVPWAIINTFLTDYFVVDLKLGTTGATALMISLGAGCTVGTLAGSWLGESTYRRDVRLLPILMCITCVLATTFLVALLAIGAHHSLWLLHVLIFLAGSQAAVAGNNAKAILMNTTSSRVRGTSFGILRFMDDVGKVLGPIVISRLVYPLGRKIAFMIGIACWLPCALCCGLLALTVVGDEKRSE